MWGGLPSTKRFCSAASGILAVLQEEPRKGVAQLQGTYWSQVPFVLSL